MPICTRCSTDKAPGEFHKETARKNGLNSYCRVCATAYNQQRAKKYAAERGTASITKSCTKCSAEKPIAEFYACQKSRDGYGNWCKDCWLVFDRERSKRPDIREAARIRCKKSYQKHQAERIAYTKTPVGRFQAYRNDARQRDYGFSLTKNEFMLFWQKPCFYCGDAIPTVGLDRVDNSRGYVLGNVVSCCKTCNFAKHQLDRDAFITHCQKVAAKFATSKINSQGGTGCPL